MLQQLGHVGPDVHQILEVVEDLRAALDGVPGMGLLKRLGDRKDDDEALAERASASSASSRSRRSVRPCTPRTGWTF